MIQYLLSLYTDVQVYVFVLIVLKRFYYDSPGTGSVGVISNTVEEVVAAAVAVVWNNFSLHKCLFFYN